MVLEGSSLATWLFALFKGELMYQGADQMLRHVESFIAVVGLQDLIWSVAAPSVLLGTPSLQTHWCPLWSFSQSGINKIIKYPGLKRNQNNINVLKERMGH